MRGRSPLLSVAALASIGAGSIHATAAGMHNDHRQALWAFVGLAVFQIGWGALALGRSTGSVVPIALLGAAGNAAAFGGWLLAKTSGIGFIDGLEESEGVQTADGIAAGLAAVAVLVALMSLVGRLDLGRVGSTGVLGAAALATVALTLPGMISAGEHSHVGGGHDGEQAEGGHSHGETTGETSGDDASHPLDSTVVPYDPTQPIDLGGMDGVTPEQQARAENLIAITLARLPQFADTAVAEAAGYRSIGDAATGDEHYVNWSLVDDATILDPDHPESLVYEVGRDGTCTLEAAMFMLPRSTTLDAVPDVGGKLTQFHVHNDLCLSPPPDAKVVAIVGEDDECRPPLSKLGAVPMLHVWITPHPCGPFASLDGVGAGQVQEGEERLCDHLHTSG